MAVVNVPSTGRSYNSESYNFALKVQFDKKIVVTGITTHNWQAVIAPRIYNASGTLLASGSTVAVNSTGQITLPLSSSVTLNANTTYYIGVSKDSTTGYVGNNSGNYTSPFTQTGGGITMTVTSPGLYSPDDKVPNTTYGGDKWYPALGVSATIAESPPSAPTGVSAIAGTTSAAIYGTPQDADVEPARLYVEWGIGTYSNVSQSSSVTSGTATSVSLTGLLPNTTYLYRVRTLEVDTGITSAHTGDLSFTTGNVAPYSPSSVSASPSTTSATVYGTVSDPYGDSCRLVIQYGLSTSFGSTVYSSYFSSGSQAFATLSNLQTGQTYYYRTYTEDAYGAASGYSPSSGAYSFATTIPNILPNAATSVAVSATPTTATITGNVSDADGDTCRLVVEYGTTTSLGSTATGNYVASGSQASVSLTNLTAGTTYYYRVRVQDSKNGYSGYTPSSGTNSFVTNMAPAAPTFANLSSNGYTLNRRPKFFITVSDPDTGNTVTNLQVQISTTSAFSSLAVDAQKLADSGFGTTTAGFTGLPTASNASATVTWVPQADLPTSILYLRVRAKDNNNLWSAWSATQQFTVALAPWDDTIPDDATGFKAAWLVDLANAINAARQFRGLAVATFTDGSLTNAHDIKAIHVTERRTKLAECLQVVGQFPSWTDATLTSDTDRKGKHIRELRNFCLIT